VLRGALSGASLRPAQLVVAGFVVLICIGALLLRLPLAVDPGITHPGWVDSLFWSTSASTVTGLGPTDVADFSLFGELVLLALIQIGGFGIMTVGSVVVLVLANRVGLRQRIIARTEIGAIELGDLRDLMIAIAKITLVAELGTAIFLFIAFARVEGTSAGAAAYQALFHGVSSFNNAGISLFSDSLEGFVTNPMVIFPVSAAFIVGGLGFPVLVELWRRVRPLRWTLHTKITLAATLVLLVYGPLVVLTFEWTNPDTLGPLSVLDKLQASWFEGTTPRTAGFNVIPVGALDESTELVTTVLMFVGAGSASTSGGIKVTTFAVLFFVLWSEARGDQETTVFHRRISYNVVRQAITVALLAVAIVFCTALALTAISPFDFIDTLFEATSAFGTVGLSTGITGELSNWAELLLIGVMFVGRVGPVTFVAALALRTRRRAYRYPEERPIIG
jgi:potassium uptake TrkH family protein